MATAVPFNKEYLFRARLQLQNCISLQARTALLRRVIDHAQNPQTMHDLLTRRLIQTVSRIRTMHLRVLEPGALPLELPPSGRECPYRLNSQTRPVVKRSWMRLADQQSTNVCKCLQRHYAITFGDRHLFLQDLTLEAQPILANGSREVLASTFSMGCPTETHARIATILR